MANKRKTTTAIVAGVTAAALLLGGTFAWVSISQQAKNEAAGIVNVGGRLHDDFNGTNKDVYVENFTDPYNGGQPIYARIKLTEYMEVGQDAGGFGTDTNGDGKITAVPVVSGTDINDKDNWPVHVPTELCTICGTGETCLIHDHWTWTMGGDEGSTGSTIFMPTFNKDKDSLDADINGTYAGTNPNDKVYYDDYVTYVTENGTVVDLTADFTKPEGAETANALTEANTDVTTVTGTAYYDDDTNTNENDHENEIGVKVETETHTAKETAGATVITMNEWLTTYNSKPGNYWVYDEDGWAYWANPIMPGEATGLLLDGIEMTKNPGEKCYYAINVVGQFATVGDWEQFGVSEEDEDYPSDDAIALLTKASESVPTVTVTNVTGDTLVNRGDEVTFSATTAIGAAAAAADGEYEWVVLNEDREVITSSTIAVNADGNAILTVGPEELSEGLYVAARDTQTGAVGLSAVAMQLYDVTISEQNGANEVYAGDSLQFSAGVVDSITGNAETSGVTWSVTGGSDEATTINSNGVLTVGENEVGGKELTVTATSVTGSFTETYTVTVGYKLTLESSGTFDMVNGLRVNIKESYYNAADITATISDDISDKNSNVKFNYRVDEDENGIYLMITHDDESYEYADHGTRRLTVKAAGYAESTYEFTCNCHTDKGYTVDTGNVVEIDALKYTDNLQVKFLQNGTEVDNQYITWSAVTNSKSAGSYLSDSKILYLDASEYSPYVRIACRTENAWVIKDLRLRYAETDEVKGMTIEFFRKDEYSGEIVEDDKDTVKYDENRASDQNGSGWTYIYRVYDANGNIIDQPLNLSIWTGDTNITFNPYGGEGLPGTNGYENADNSSMKDGYGSYWLWTARGNTEATSITFWISYVNADGEVGTFEATIW